MPSRRRRKVRSPLSDSIDDGHDRMMMIAPPELAVDHDEPDWDYNYRSSAASCLQQHQQRTKQRTKQQQQQHQLFCTPVAAAATMSTSTASSSSSSLWSGENDEGISKYSLRSRASLLLCRAPSQRSNDDYDNDNLSHVMPLASQIQLQKERRDIRQSLSPPPPPKQSSPKRSTPPKQHKSRQSNDFSIKSRQFEAARCHAMVDDMDESVHSQGCSNTATTPGCSLGLALYPLMRLPTPPRCRQEQASSPRSTTMWHDDASFHDDELLELQRELKALKRWAAKSPNVNNNTNRVRFAHPIVTAVKHRPYTTADEKDILYFDEGELRQLEWDREQRLPEEQVECIASHTNNETQRLSVSVSFPKRLSRQERAQNRRLNRATKGDEKNMFAV